MDISDRSVRTACHGRMHRMVRLAALPCLLAYFVLRPGPPDYDKFFKRKPVPSAPADHYGLEKISHTIRASGRPG